MGLMVPLGSPGRKSPLEKRRREEKEENFQDKIPGQVEIFSQKPSQAARNGNECLFYF